MNNHEHDFWRTPSGGLECACGQPKRPIAAPDPEPELQAQIDRFGIFEEDGS